MLGIQTQAFMLVQLAAYPLSLLSNVYRGVFYYCVLSIPEGGGQSPCPFTYDMFSVKEMIWVYFKQHLHKPVRRSQFQSLPLVSVLAVLLIELVWSTLNLSKENSAEL